MMSTRSKLLSMAQVPACFIGAFVLAFALVFLAMSAGDAFAQPGPAEQPEPTQVDPNAGSGGMPDHGFAPPSDEVPPPPDEHATEPGGEHAATAHGGHEASAPHGAAHAGHGDPTKHFNYLNGGGGLFGYMGKDAYGGPMGDGKMVDTVTGEVVNEEEKMSPPFIFMVINFLILFGLLAWKGGPIARNAAAERHDQIKSALDEAAKLREQAAAKLADYEARLKAADAEIKAMVEGIRKDAEADKVRILENAEHQSAQMRKDAELRIAAEIEFARAALTREVTDAAAAATEKLLRDKLMPGDQSKLVGTFITDLGTTSESPHARR